MYVALPSSATVSVVPVDAVVFALAISGTASSAPATTRAPADGSAGCARDAVAAPGRYSGLDKDLVAAPRVGEVRDPLLPHLVT